MADQTIDLTPQVVNLRLTRGDAWSLVVTFEATDLTGYTFAAQIRARVDDEDATDIDIAETNLADGVITIGQDEAETSGHWDLQATPPAGLPRTYMGGAVTVKKDVTRP
jgi:hypothetical protein